MLEFLPKRRRVSGLRIDPHKADSTLHPIAADFVPKVLRIPIETHRGCAPQTIVRAGENVLRGQVLAQAQPGSGVPDIHASSSGRVREITSQQILGARGAENLACIVIDTDGRDNAIDAAASAFDLRAADHCAQIEQIRNAGVVGLGGAAVSTSWKLTTDEPPPTLIINGAECEPYISCDDMLMRERATEILAGSLQISSLLGVRQCIVAIERDKPQAIAAMRAAAKTFADDRLALAELPSIYPAGGERQLIELLLNTEVPSGAYPADLGIVCQNVGTALAVHRALTANEPLISRVVTLTGRGIAEPRNVYARIGTSAAELIAHFGGYAHDPAALIIGGSMMGVAQSNDDIPVTKATNCILVTSSEQLNASAHEWPCIRCGECAGACPARLLPQELLRAVDNNNVTDLAGLGLSDCIECGCCDAICPSHIALTQRFIVAKQQLEDSRKAQEFAELSQQRFARRTARLRAEETRLQHEREALRARLGDGRQKERSIAAALERAAKRSRKTVEKS